MEQKPSLLPEKINSPQSLLDALNAHDWWYAKSDDHREWSRGKTDWERIVRSTKTIPNGDRILRLFSKIRSLIDFGHE